MGDISISLILILIFLCIGASLVQRVSGFGFGIFIMTALPFITPSYAEATTLSGLLAATLSAYVLISMWRLVNWKQLTIILLAFSVVAYFSVDYVAKSAETHLKLLLGITLIILSLYFLFICKHINVKPTCFLQITMGGLSGAMGGLFGMHGPPAVIYFLASQPDKNHYMATTQAFFLISNLILTAFRANNGFITPFVCYGWITACIGVAIGSYIGKLIFDRISSETLRKIIYVYMIFAGVTAILS